MLDMELRSPDGGETGEHNDIGFVEISKIFAMQDVFLFWIISFDRVYH